MPTVVRACAHMRVCAREGESTDFAPLCLRVQRAGRSGVTRVFLLFIGSVDTPHMHTPTRVCADPFHGVACFCLPHSHHLRVNGALPLCLHRHPLLERLTVIK